MQYKNNLTTPSGRYVEVLDVTNAQYLVLLKYLQAENYDNFFAALNQLATKSVPDFEQFDIVDKCYVYIAMCMYSLHATISINTLMGPQQVGISTVLDNIENAYTRDVIEEYQLKEGMIFKFKYPTRFFFNGGQTPNIDYFSGLVSVRDKELTLQQKLTLKSTLPTKHQTFIDDFLRQRFSKQIDVLHGVMGAKQSNVNIFGEGLLYLVISFYKMNLNDFYNIMYTVIKHVRMSYSDFMKITHNETSILIKFALEETKKMNSAGNLGAIMENEL